MYVMQKNREEIFYGRPPFLLDFSCDKKRGMLNSSNTRRQCLSASKKEHNEPAQRMAVGIILHARDSKLQLRGSLVICDRFFG